MSITVYWTVNPYTNIGAYRAEDPLNISSKFFSTYLPKIKNINSDYSKCPFVREHLKKIYGIKQIYDATFNFDFDKEIYKCENWCSDLFDKLIVRSFSDNLFSWGLGYIFFTEQKSLIMKTYPPYLEDNEINKKTIMIPGAYDIGNWFRPLDFSFHLKKDFKNDSLTFNSEDVITYVEFETDDSISFEYFHMNPELDDIKNNLMATKWAVKKSHSNSWFYDIFKTRKIKKEIIQNIKNNLS